MSFESQDCSTLPTITSCKGVAYFVWEQDGSLMRQRGSSPPVRFAAKAAASIAATPDRGPVVVWESTGMEPHTLLAEVVE